MMAPAAALVSTEALKLRRTMALRMAAAAPAFAILLELLMLFNRRAFPYGDAAAVWRSLYRGGWLFWIGFFVPVLVAFEAASLANVEHRGKQWKQLFASPIPRWSVYAVKMLFCGLLVGASFAIVAPGLVGDVLVYSTANGYRMAIPWSEVVNWAGRAWLASWLAVAAQTWLSARFAGIAPPLGIALAGLVLGVVVQGSVLQSLCPWTAALRTIEAGPMDVHNTQLPVVFGCLGGVVAGVLACWDLARREVV